MIQSWKKMLLITLLFGGLGTSLSIEAQARPNGPKMGQMLFKDVDLSQDQREALKALKKGNKAARKTHREEYKGKRMEWLEEFADGRKSRSEVLREIANKTNDKFMLRQERLEGMLEVLSDLDRDQKSQVLDNLEDMRDRMEARRADFEEKRGTKGKRGKRGKKKFDRMFQGMSLSADQESIVTRLKEFHQDKRSNKRGIHKEKHEMMVDFVSGDKSKRDLLGALQDKKRDVLQTKREGAGIWMDLLSSFDEEQKDIFFDNMADIKQEHKERREDKKDRRNRRKSDE